MRKTKRLYVLLGVLAAVCVVTFAVSRYETKKEDIKASGEVVFTIDPDAVTALSWEQGSSSLAFTRTDGAWQYDGDAAFPVDQDKIAERLDAFVDFAAAYVIDDVTDYAQYGLDTPALTVALDYTDADGAAQSFTLAISKNAQELSVAEKNGEDAADVQAYARVGDSPIVYEISADSYDRLMAAGYDDLRHRELFTADFADVTAVTAALDGETYSLELRADEDSKKLLSEVENVWYCGGEKIDIDALEDALVSLSAESFTDEKPTGKCELSLTLALDNARFPEVSIALYRADGSRCLAAADGVTVGYVPRSEVVDLIEAVNAIVLGSPEESGSG